MSAARTKPKPKPKKVVDMGTFVANGAAAQKAADAEIAAAPPPAAPPPPNLEMVALALVNLAKRMGVPGVVVVVAGEGTNWAANWSGPLSVNLLGLLDLAHHSIVKDVK